MTVFKRIWFREKIEGREWQVLAIYHPSLPPPPLVPDYERFEYREDEVEIKP